MAKRKRGLIFTTFVLSAIAAVISIVSLVTQEWVTSLARSSPDTAHALTKDYVRFGLFAGIFKQTSAVDITYELSMTCLYEKNICALLCGDNMEANLKKLYFNQQVSQDDLRSCAKVISNKDIFSTYDGFFTRSSKNFQDKTFLNAGVVLSSIVFLCISIAMGLLSAGLSLWNTIFDPSQLFIRVFGLYTYNIIAFFSVLLTIVIWGAMYAKELLLNEVPTYKTFLEDFTTKGYAKLGYSYWINLISLIFYLGSLVLLYNRNYLLAQGIKEDADNLQQNARPLVNLSHRNR